MAAQLFDIVGRAKPSPVHRADLADFDRGAGRTADPTVLLLAPEWSLYALCFETGSAVFVACDPDKDLSAAPFVYQRQFERAQQVMLVPFEDFVALSERLSTIPRTTFLFSTGRCGSTLASRILAQIDTVWSLSEPDVFTNLAFARFVLSPEQLGALSKAATRFLFRPPPERPSLLGSGPSDDSDSDVGVVLEELSCPDHLRVRQGRRGCYP